MQFIKTASIGAILSLAAVMPNAYAVKDGQKFKDWEGKCTKGEKQEVCGIIQVIKGKENNPAISISIYKEKGQEIAFVKVPLGVDLGVGLAFAIDKKKIAQVPYAICDPGGCNAIFPVTKELAEKMKKGKKIQFGMSFSRKPYYNEGSLSGFTNALNAL